MNSKVLLIFLLIFLGVLSIIFLKKSYQEILTPKIGVTIFPFYDLIREIIRDKFEVVLIIPPGAELHNFELQPKDIKKLLGLKIVFITGTYLDQGAENFIKNFKGVKIIPLAEEVNLIKNKGEIDPHFWLSLENMKLIAKKVEAEMEIFDPGNKEFYRKNLENVLKKLDNLLVLAQEELKDKKTRYIITQHNAFNYLAQELNLSVLGYLEGISKELTPSELKNLVDKIRLFKIEVVFQEPGEESNLLKALAQELNLKIYQLDPLEGKGGLDYFKAYQKNIEILKEALK